MKNTTNIFKILFLTLFPIATMMGQNPAFVYLPDMTGYSLEESPLHLKDDLMEAADSLRAALPEDYRSDFAVYDMGFYAHHPNMVGGIPEVMAKTIDDHVTHSYYLVFGREMDREGRIKKVWVVMELPEGGYMECLIEFHRELLYLQIINTLADFNHSRMVEAMGIVENKLKKLSTCCLPTFRTSCDLCLDSVEVRTLFEGRNSFSSPSNIAVDSAAFLSGSSRSGLIIGEDYWIVDLDGEGRLISDVVSDLNDLLSDIDLSFQAFVTSSATTCDDVLFQSIEHAYINSDADVRMRLHIDQEEGVLYDVPDFTAIWDYYGNQILDFYDAQFNNLNQLGTHRSVGSGSMDCKRTNRFKFSLSHVYESHEDHYITKSEGYVAHNLIQSHYRVINPTYHDIQLEFKIPQASSKNPGLKPGYADIINLSTGEIFEIKTVNSWEKGVKQVELYVEKANQYCKSILPFPLLGFTRGKMYPRKVELPWITPNKKLISHRHANAAPEFGVISYKLKQRDKKWEPSLDPIFIPQTKWDKVKNIINDMRKSPTPQQLAWDFFTENPEMIAFVAAAAVGTIVVIVLAGVKTGGISLAPTAQVAVMAGLLIYVAVTIDIEPEPESNGP